ncbi:MAG: molybdenum cofactor biosynthesis protein MoaE [Candidatus Hodarchaeaceae archaeon]|nr:molybdenum cofactor biosynthesis protein MoaE [Candidatus Hodarchaeaceae archaeon]
MADVGIHRKGELDLPKLLEEFRQDLRGNVGAIGCFIGVVRHVSKDGEEVKRLHYECSEDAVKKLEQIARDVEKDPKISRVMIHHIIDDLTPGDDAIYVIVGGRHRSDVFSALQKIMNRIKTEVPIWKKEVTESGEYWVHEGE